ncbi:riboflavin kinase [Sporobolomyces salmoneus]|uniref:riboflavin kinase n=1 Tax=Sporobolomyces salmoneus TaxID=183962 RepID=UPI003172D4BA
MSSSTSTRPAPLQHDPELVRPEICGPEDGPDSTVFPVKLSGWVSRGFGRGSKDLGCPTANLPDSSINPYYDTLSTGVYFGFARVLESETATRESKKSAFNGGGEKGEDDKVHPMVMSIGWNPFYNNDTRTAEVHILHQYPSDFYGKELRVIMLGFIRPEYNYTSMDALIKDIEFDKQVALRSTTTRPPYSAYQEDDFFFEPSKLEPTDEDLSKPRVKPTEAASTA